MVEVHIKQIVVEHPGDERADEGGVEAQPDGIVAFVGPRRVAVPESVGKDRADDAQEGAEAEQTHAPGDGEVDAGDGRVQVDVGRTGEADAEDGVAGDEPQGILILAETHLRRQVCPLKALDEAADVGLRDRQQQQQHGREGHVGQQAAIASDGHETQPGGQPQHGPTREGQDQGDEDQPGNAPDNPTPEKGLLRRDLRADQRADHQQQPAERVGIHRGANGSLGKFGVFLDVANYPAARIAEAGQGVERAVGRVVGQQPQADGNHRRGRAHQQQELHQSLQPQPCAAIVDDDDDEAQAEQQFGEFAQQRRGQGAVSEAEDKSKDGDDNEQDQRQGHRCGDEPPLAAGDDA